MEHDLIFIGDSITKGTYTAKGEPAPLSVADPNFATLLAARFGMPDMINYGRNGISYSSLSPVESQFSLARMCEGFDTARNIFLLAGTNDFGTSVPLGCADDRGDVSFYGATDLVFSVMRAKNPNAAIFVVLPIPRVQTENSLGLTLDAYRNALAEVAARHGFFIIDGRGLPIDPTDPAARERLLLDGTHPSPEGHALMAELIAAQAEELLCREK